MGTARPGLRAAHRAPTAGPRRLTARASQHLPRAQGRAVPSVLGARTHNRAHIRNRHRAGSPCDRRARVCGPGRENSSQAHSLRVSCTPQLPRGTAHGAPCTWFLPRLPTTGCPTPVRARQAPTGTIAVGRRTNARSPFVATQCKPPSASETDGSSHHSYACPCPCPYTLLTPHSSLLALDLASEPTEDQSVYGAASEHTRKTLMNHQSRSTRRVLPGTGRRTRARPRKPGCLAPTTPTAWSAMPRESPERRMSGSSSTEHPRLLAPTRGPRRTRSSAPVVRDQLRSNRHSPAAAAGCTRRQTQAAAPHPGADDSSTAREHRSAPVGMRAKPRITSSTLALQPSPR